MRDHLRRSIPVPGAQHPAVLTGVKVVRPVGRSTLTPAPRRDEAHLRR